MHLRVFLADTTTILQEDDATAETGIGFCRFGDVTRNGSTVECVAHTRAGVYEGSFLTDGTPPKLDTFQIGQMLLRFTRDRSGKVTGLEYSNPLLRKVKFKRTE